MDDRTFFNAVLSANFMVYLGVCFRHLNPETEFVQGLYLRAMACELDLITQGKQRRTIISVPPRHLKSMMISVAYTTWRLGIDPTLKIIGVSYSGDLAEEFGRQSLRVMRSPWYQSAFPKTRLDKSKCSPSEFHTTKGGFRIATSVGGTLTGKGGDLIVLDDPLKPADAMSEVKRRALQEWYSNTLLSRLDNPLKGAIILVSQRVHTDDLTGFLLEKDEGWKHLCLPAIALRKQKLKVGKAAHHTWNPGDLLHPERIDQRELNSIKASMGTFHFEAQYQQSPSPPGGNFIKLKWLKRLSTLPPGSYYNMIMQSWDTAVETGENNDFSACTTWGVRSDGYYLLDVFRDRLNYPDLKKKVIELKAQFNAHVVVVEKVNNGAALYQDLGGPGTHWLQCVNPTEDKVTRTSHVLALLEQGHIVLPHEAEWIETFLKELSEFPFGKFDDQVDSFTQFLYVTRLNIFRYRYGRDYKFQAAV